MAQGYFAQNVTRFTCLDNSDIFFRGTTVSPMHSYLHFELLACEEQALRQTQGYEDAECATEAEVRRFFSQHMLIGYVANTFVNKTQFEGNPVRTLNDVIFYEQLDIDEHLGREVQLNYNEVELKDSYFRLWDE